MILRFFFITLFIILSCTGCYTNLHQVLELPPEKTRFYRSGQMRDWQLQNSIEQYKIKKVINLRGISEDKPWYQKEIKVCKDNQVEHVSVKLRAWKAPEKKELLALVEHLEDSERNNITTLVHCYGGADRASLASALIHILIDNASIERALDEYKILYGHLCCGGCQPEAVLNAYKPFQNKMEFKTWVEKHYRREDFLEK